MKKYTTEQVNEMRKLMDERDDYFDVVDEKDHKNGLYGDD
jgi:hypothetical protein